MFSQLPHCFTEEGKDVAISSSKKIDWLRSQIIGDSLEFETPFGKRLMTYADHTASARSLRFIETFIVQKMLPVYGNTHTQDSFVGSVTGNVVAQAQKYVKECMGGTDEEAIFFCGSGSTAAIKKLQEVMGIAVPSTLREQVLGTVKKKQRWVVFVGPYEHHSNLLSWRQSLAEVVEIPLTKEGVVDIGSLQTALQMYKNRPKLGCFSAGSNVTGILTETRRIAHLLHIHGAFACFDFAACAPYVKIDMRSGKADGYDAVFVSPHKFMGGPGTPGILLMNKNLYLLENNPPSTCGGGTVDFVNFDEQKTIYYEDIEHRENAGTPPIIQIVKTALVYNVKEFLTTKLILSREAKFIDEAMSRLGKNPNIQIYGPTTVKRIAILSFGVYPDIHLSLDEDFDTDNTYPEDHRPAFQFFRSPGRIGLWFSSPQHPQWTMSPKNKRTEDQLDSRPKSPFRLAKPLHYFSRARSPHQVRDTGIKDATQVSPIRVDKARGKPLHGRFIVTLLNDLFGIQARGGCSCAGTYGHRLLDVDMALSLALRGGIKKGYTSLKPGWARVSFGYYLSNEEFEFLLSAIEFVAEFGAKFLQLYDMDWTTGDWTITERGRHICDAITNLELEEKVYDGKERLGSLLGSRLNLNSSFDVPSLTTEEYNERLSSYLKIARYQADCLPDEQIGSTRRKIPSDLDPSLITFII